MPRRKADPEFTERFTAWRKERNAQRARLDMGVATVLREELAVNAHRGDEGQLRCTCDECIEALALSGIRVVDADRIRKVFKELDETAHMLPIPKEWLSHPSVEAFSLAKHHLHVLLHEIASGGRTETTGRESNG